MSKRIGILTSSRADFGIYLPLLNQFKIDTNFELSLIVFGTHLSKNHGYTVDEIIAEGFEPNYKVFVEQIQNDKYGIAENYAAYGQLFAEFWNSNGFKFDLVFSLGDRYEMAAAVLASIPFGIKIAHIHAGETTLGAIDNIYRHCITQASSVCFTSTEEYKERVLQLVESTIPIFNVGALSLDDLSKLELPTKEFLAQQFNLDFSKPLIMVVFHPETVSPEKNKDYIGELLRAIDSLKEYSFAINLPNADTYSDIIRSAILEYKAANSNDKRITIVEHFGKRNYFACLKYASLLIGNSSSGIIEAASFGKYVLNMGDRQKGRIQSDNTSNCKMNYLEIISQINTLIKQDTFNGENKYQHKKKTAELIIDHLKAFLFK